MSARTSSTGSAESQGALWGARPESWAANEEQQLPTYEAAIRRCGIGAGLRVLEVGCGSGVFLRAAADRGARVAGVDSAAALIELARARVPEAELTVGDMQCLPYPDDAFDVVVGFNAFFFADDMVAALREAGRVARLGAPVVIQVWGRPERCDLTAMKRALATLLPAPEPDAPAAPALWQDGVLEGVAAEAGLSVSEAYDVSWTYEFCDEAALTRALLAPGPIIELIGIVGEDAVRAAVVESLAPYRASDGAYRLENEWHTLIARA